MPELVTVPRGLAGVVVTDTTIGHVRGLEGFYHYRQYSAIDLAERRTLEDVWALLIDGALPAASLQEEIAPLRHIPPVVAAALPSIAAASSSVDPMGGLRAALAVAGLAAGAKPLYDTSPPERRSQAMRLCALTPSLLAALYRLRLGLEVVEPRDDLPHAANYLYMITGS
ncbi:MAG: citrate synthase/methylcitrate synthase, partial [Hamadaea sp.]|nr:citrate synthase/methylcitrate synthase [Hamadaea sp.]